ncbi:M28 family peptidase [Brevundimonas sp.]|uniref:M28 family peptidase n=1 Tax=Brevundimonas sp. TaxID=1871086 RepID=UPI00289A21D5|nr:M28 family peptidase [Brevundimonas sp.]
MRPVLASLTAIAAALTLAGCETTTPEAAATGPVATTVADYTQLMDDLRILSADDMQGRDTGSEGGAKAREYIVARLEALGVQPSPMGRLQPWEMQGRTREGVKTFSGTNIIGVIPGTRVADKYIVVTAHYDHVGVNNGQIYNGADDNASGVATMLELAKRLKASPPEHSVLIVALDGEERSLLGAKHFVEAPPVPLSSISMNLNFDMTARADSDGKLWVTGTYQHPYFRPLLERIAPRGTVSLAFGKDTPEDKGADNWVEASDHAAFHRAGLPFLYFGVNYHADYHRPTDDFDKVVPATFQSSTELAIEGFRALDQWLDQ